MYSVSHSPPGCLLGKAGQIRSGCNNLFDFNSSVPNLVNVLVLFFLKNA